MSQHQRQLLDSAVYQEGAINKQSLCPSLSTFEVDLCCLMLFVRYLSHLSWQLHAISHGPSQNIFCVCQVARLGSGFHINNTSACIVEEELLRFKTDPFAGKAFIIIPLVPVLTVIGNYPSMLCTNNPVFNDDNLFSPDIEVICISQMYTDCSNFG